MGDEGTILRRGADGWTSQPSGTDANLHAIWGSGPTNVVIVGDGGTILRYDGKRWQQDESNSLMGLRAVWGSSPSRVFASGEGTSYLQFDGKRWQQRPPGKHIFTGAHAGLWGHGKTGLFMVWCKNPSKRPRNGSEEACCIAEPGGAESASADLTETGRAQCTADDFFESHSVDGVAFEDNDEIGRATRLLPITDEGWLATSSTDYDTTLSAGDTDWFVFEALDKTDADLIPVVKFLPLSPPEGVDSLATVYSVCAYASVSSALASCPTGHRSRYEDPVLGTLNGCCALDHTDANGYFPGLKLEIHLDRPDINDDTDVYVRVMPEVPFPDDCQRYNVIWGVGSTI